MPSNWQAKADYTGESDCHTDKLCRGKQLFEYYTGYKHGEKHCTAVCHGVVYHAVECACEREVGCGVKSDDDADGDCDRE